MKFNSSSWFPLNNFTKSGCHFDWMMGVTKFSGVKDFLDPLKIIPQNATVFWNRTLGANIMLETYERARNEKNPDMVKKCEEIGLPMDINV